MQALLSNKIKPTLWKVGDEIPLAPIIHEATFLIRSGRVVVYPTETFYALGGLPSSKLTIKRIFEIKGRDSSKPLPLIASSREDIKKAVARWPDTADKLAGAFWPGPLTLLLFASRELPPELHLITGRIAIRISPHPVARALAAAVGGLLISTSANSSGQPAIADPDNLEPALLSRIDGLIDAGKLTGQKPSTIVDLSDGPPRLVRTGYIPWHEIEAVLHS